MINSEIITNVFIRKPLPTMKEKCVQCAKGTFFIDHFYDEEKEILFHVMKEPSWIKFEPDTTYEIEFSDYNDDDTYDYRLYKRLNEDTIIVAGYYEYKKAWETTKIGYIAENTKFIPVEKYQLKDSITISPRKETEVFIEITHADTENW